MLIESHLIVGCCSVVTGEDGCEMSAAGQMETVLGVLGLEKVIANQGYVRFTKVVLGLWRSCEVNEGHLRLMKVI